MTRFDEICRALTDAKLRFFTERDACCEVATLVAEGLRKYLETPAYHLYFMPRSREGSSIKIRTAKDVTWHSSEGWHFNIGLVVSDTGDAQQYETGPEMVIARLLVRPQADGFEVGLEGWPDRFVVQRTPVLAVPEAFYDFVFKNILDAYGRSWLKFVEGGGETQRILGETVR